MQSVVVSSQQCEADSFPLTAFLDSLRVELAGRGLHCCALAEPGDVTSPKVPLRVNIAQLGPCGTELERVRITVQKPDGLRTLDREISLSDVAPSARPRALALAVAELIRLFGQEVRDEPPQPSPKASQPALSAPQQPQLKPKAPELGWAGTGGVGAGGSSVGGSSTGGGSSGVRIVQNFNQAWKFKRADVSGAQANAFDDSSWGNVGLPHSFGLPYFASTKFYVGYGWYRKHFTVPSSWSGKRVFLEFQAAFDQAQIYINGTQVGKHIGGYNGFSIDISSAIKTGDNVVAVRLNDNWNAQIPPLTGDHTFQGGLYRDVNVVVTDPLHVAWYGTWVTTPTLATNSGASSTVNIKTEVRNDRTAAVNATLKTDIVDSSGKVVSTVSSQQQIAAGATVTFDQTTPAVSAPSLWHPDHPTMYQALAGGPTMVPTRALPRTTTRSTPTFSRASRT